MVAMVEARGRLVDGGHSGTPDKQKGRGRCAPLFRSQDGPFARPVNVLQRNTAMQARER